MQHVLKLNQHEFDVTFSAQLLPVDDPGIQDDKKVIYRQIGLTVVPFVDVIYKARDVGIAALLTNLTLKPFLNHKIHYLEEENLYLNYSDEAILFDMLLDAKRNNAHNDLLREYFLDKDSKIVRDQTNNKDRAYVRWSPVENERSALNESVVKSWRQLANQSLGSLEKTLEGILRRNSVHLGVIEWGTYISNAINRVMPKQIGDNILVVDTRDQSRDWVKLLLDYREANPNITSETELSMTADRPSDYDLLNRSKISIAMLDNGVMIGYITCSVMRITHTPTEDNGDLHHMSTDFQRFYAAWRVRKNPPTDTLGFDVFKINGVHLNEKYRSTKNDRHRGKELFFCGLAFIWQTYKQLGINLIAVDSEAAGTMRILTDTFGFTFFNRSKELNWLSSRLGDYKELYATPIANEKYRAINASSLLTKESIGRAIDNFVAKNIIEQPRNHKFRRVNFNTKCRAMFKTTKTVLENPTREKMEALEKRYNDAYKQIYKEDRTQDAGKDTDMEFQHRVNALFDEFIDDQDTFLYMDPIDTFEQKMNAFISNFNAQVTNEANDENINPVRTQIIIIDDSIEEEEEEDVFMAPESKIPDPDEEDLIMYEKFSDYAIQRKIQSKIDALAKDYRYHVAQARQLKNSIDAHGRELEEMNKKTYIF